MSHHVRLMRQEDLPQVIEIDREAFPTDWPLPDFRYELQNRLAHYLVACGEETTEKPEVEPPSERESTGLAARVMGLFSRRSLSNGASSRDFIIGFVGFWVMADEAHISSIAVRETYRQQGAGELLLMSAIDLARELKASIVTLEVRVSNTSAQHLYDKYGFTQVGLRRGYYTDNREDALLMSTQDINSEAFQTQFQQLKQALLKEQGVAFS